MTCGTRSKRYLLGLAALLLFSLPSYSQPADSAESRQPASCETFLDECAMRLERANDERERLTSVVSEQTSLIDAQRSLILDQNEFVKMQAEQLAKRDSQLNRIETFLDEFDAEIERVERQLWWWKAGAIGGLGASLALTAMLILSN